MSELIRHHVEIGVVEPAVVVVAIVRWRDWVSVQLLLLLPWWDHWWVLKTVHLRRREIVGARRLCEGTSSSPEVEFRWVADGR